MTASPPPGERAGLPGDTRPAGGRGARTQAGAPGEGSDERTPLRRHLALLTVFWIYVALSNVLYAGSMQAGLTALNADQLYAPWNVRLLQHAVLYPVLLGCVWGSLRVGWRPLPRALPLQLLLALLFSALPMPVLWVSERAMQHVGLAAGRSWQDMLAGPQAYMWLAGATDFLLTYGFGLALITGLAFHQRLRASELRRVALEHALDQAQLAALRMQLSPHTLFNLLHTIRGQIAWDPVSAQAMVVQLADLLRGLLAAGGRELSPLADELRFVRLYLGLQQKRFADRLSVEVPERETQLAAWVPSLILHPLIENAVVHGLAGHDGPVAIRVEALVREETLLLRVSNTVGAATRRVGAGIGLRNVRERLGIQFGERAQLTATRGLNGLWLAEVRMPLLCGRPAAGALEHEPEAVAHP